MSGYRDDREQLRLRVEELEDELGEARDRLARVNAPAESGGWVRTVFGAPSTLRVERELPGELSEDAREEALEVLRRTFGQIGNPSHTKRSLTWTTTQTRNGGRAVEVMVSARDGKLRIELAERMGGLLGGLWGGVGGGVGGGSLGFVIPIAIQMGSPALIPVAFVLWMLLVGGVVRSAVSALATRRERQLRACAEELDGALAKERVRVVPQRNVRVVDDEPMEDDAPDEDEALAERSQPARARRS